MLDTVMNPSPGRVLIVDDELNIRKGLRAILAKSGHMVKDVGTVDEALALLESFDCEVAIVDIRMPGRSGVELLTAVRAQWPHIAVIMLTGNGTLESAITAVKAGAHDYLLKPAQPVEIRQTVADALTVYRQRRRQKQLLQSLRVGLQQLDQQQPVAMPAQTSSDSRQLTIGDLHINLQAHEVRRGGDPISLTPSEFNLLVALASRPGQVIDYVTLVQLSLNYQAETWEAKELIKRHIFALRHKIEPDPASPQYILNVRGIGYKFATPQSLDN